MTVHKFGNDMCTRTVTTGRRGSEKKTAKVNTIDYGFFRNYYTRISIKTVRVTFVLTCIAVVQEDSKGEHYRLWVLPELLHKDIYQNCKGYICVNMHCCSSRRQQR